MRRARMSKRASKRAFRRTHRPKRINVRGRSMRGGIRL